MERAPWGNMYEFSCTFGLVAVGAYLVLLAAEKHVRWIGLFLITTVLLDLGLAVSVLYTDSATSWCPRCTRTGCGSTSRCAIICGAVFYLGARRRPCCTSSGTATSSRSCAGGKGGRVRLHAWSGCRPRPPWTSSPTGSTRPSSRCGPSPSSPARSGPSRAWGRYWGWDPKETWSFITWVAYACYLHARATAGWKGRKAAVLALIAFACFLFNYYGVNIFIIGRHSYSGV